MKTPITRLVIRRDEIPRSTAVTLFEQVLGRPLTHTHRHYLANRPVHCGHELMIYRNNAWSKGTYEWTGLHDDSPTLRTDDGVVWLGEHDLLRWPTKGD